MSEQESGFVEEIDDIRLSDNTFTDIEILRTTSVNIIARGRRYGRWWLLKTLVPEIVASQTFRRQFIKEFTIHSRLADPGVPQFVSVEEVEGLGRCIVSEWIEGHTLEELITSGRTSRAERRRIARELVEVISRLHARGIIHRDLKPSNIIIRNHGGRVVVIDFGLADSADFAELKVGAGTEGYISPEQAESRKATPADDVYSIGVIINSLCPSYRWLVRRCLAPSHRRPADGSELIRLINNRRRKKRYGINVAIISVVSCIILFGVMKIDELRRESSDTRGVVRELTDANRLETKKFRESQLRADSLADTLARVNSRITEIEEKQSVKQQAVEKGKKALETLFRQYDRKYMSHYGPEDQAQFSARLLELANDSKLLVDNIMNELISEGLDGIAVEEIRTIIERQFGVLHDQYNDQWLARVFPPPDG